MGKVLGSEIERRDKPMHIKGWAAGDRGSTLKNRST